jgi:hypothetical protein
VGHDFAAVWRSRPGVAAREAAQLGAVARLAVCGERVLTYRWNLGWTMHDARAQEVLARFDTGQPEAVACRDGELFIADRQRLVVVDLGQGESATPRVVASHALKTPVALLAPSPDRRVVLMPGGGTGWRLWRRGP